MNTLPSFQPYSWCYAPLPLLLWVLRLVFSFWWWCYRESSASGALQWEECEVDGDGFFLLTLEYSGGQF